MKRFCQHPCYPLIPCFRIKILLRLKYSGKLSAYISLRLFFVLFTDPYLCFKISRITEFERGKNTGYVKITIKNWLYNFQHYFYVLNYSFRFYYDLVITNINLTIFSLSCFQNWISTSCLSAQAHTVLICQNWVPIVIVIHRNERFYFILHKDNCNIM